MSNNGLGGDDVKYVKYLIQFNKRDEEQILKRETEVVVDYATTEGNFAGQRLADFYRTKKGSRIPTDDRKYVEVAVTGVRRRPKEARRTDTAERGLQLRALRDLNRAGILGNKEYRKELSKRRALWGV